MANPRNRPIYRSEEKRGLRKNWLSVSQSIYILVVSATTRDLTLPMLSLLMCAAMQFKGRTRVQETVRRSTSRTRHRPRSTQSGDIINAIRTLTGERCDVDRQRTDTKKLKDEVQRRIVCVWARLSLRLHILLAGLVRPLARGDNDAEFLNRTQQRSHRSPRASVGPPRGTGGFGC